MQFPKAQVSEGVPSKQILSVSNRWSILERFHLLIYFISHTRHDNLGTSGYGLSVTINLLAVAALGVQDFNNKYVVNFAVAFSQSVRHKRGG